VKTYPGSPKIAVKNLSLAIPQGECFGLLGENGAGKTTTISIVTGFLKPTTGYALVGGYDIRTEIDNVHLVIGVCPQFSIQWESLTVREHLLFYARLKGISPNQEKQHINKCLIDFGLENVQEKLSSELSGGMQRRLSVAIALVGNSEIVFMDEPTTGLDPASRRQLWKIINNSKAGRAIVLTTHSMEEAEVLCSRIGIVVEGRLMCLGTPLHLKNKFATGYRLSINFDSKNETEAIKDMAEMFPEARQVASYNGTKEYRLQIPNGRISEIFSMMEQRGSTNITDWSISQIGLEDVFQRIVQEGHAIRGSLPSETGSIQY